MGILWGINRSMARIHAFLLTSEQPVESDEIAESLNLSRGNISMCLRELRNWSVVQRINVSGDRRDYYVAEPDSWRMLHRIAVGRKAREFDPALNALRHLLAETNTEEEEKVHAQLTQIEEILTTLDHIVGKFLESETSSKTMLEFFKNVTAK